METPSTRVTLMNEISPLPSVDEGEPPDAPAISIIMPCLNERISLPHCIANAQRALELIALEFGLTGEVLIADNGSVDGSQALAEGLGARVVHIDRRGYGAALIGGCHAARGRLLLMGDS